MVEADTLGLGSMPRKLRGTPFTANEDGPLQTASPHVGFGQHTLELQNELEASKKEMEEILELQSVPDGGT